VRTTAPLIHSLSSGHRFQRVPAATVSRYEVEVSRLRRASRARSADGGSSLRTRTDPVA
jgi:hypothetical protein